MTDKTGKTDKTTKEEPRVNAAQVEHDLAQIDNIRRLAWQRSPADVQALIDRLRIMLLVQHHPRKRRHFYRAVTDFLEESLEERLAGQGNIDEAQTRSSVVSYLKEMLQGMDE